MKHADSQRDLLVIKNTHEKFCAGCWYIIAVNSTESLQGSKFSAFLKVEDRFTYLPDGKSFLDLVEPEKFNLYSYFLGDAKEVDIDVLVYYGDPSIYVSHKNQYKRHKPKEAQFYMNSSNSAKFGVNQLRMKIPLDTATKDLECMNASLLEH